MRKIMLGCILSAILVCGVVLKGIHKINAGYVGVVYSPNGGVQEETLKQGWNIVNPLKKVTQYSVSTEQVYLSADEREGSERNDSFVVPTSDGKMVNVDLEFSYRFDVEKVNSIFIRFKGRSGNDIINTYVRGKIKAYASEVTSTFNVLDIYGSKRSELNKKAFEHIRDKFIKDGIIIESLNFSRIGLDKDTSDAIQKRVNSQQELERQKIEKQKAEIEAQRLLIITEGEAKRKIVEAKAEAERIETLATAEAEANRLKLKSITKELIEYEKIGKWNGELPQVTGGNSLVDLR